jgi:PKD repeat protein
LALGLALALFGSAGAASADSGAAPMVSATVYASGGGTSTTSVSASQLLADPQSCPPYSQTEMTEYTSSGSTPVGLPRENGSGTGTWPMSTILQCLQNHVSLADVTGITVFNGDGSPQVASGAQLKPADLASPSDFSPNTDSPVVSDLGSSFQYNRPWRGQGDLNADDQVTSSDPIAIEVFEGPPLTVTATASPSSPAAGSSVSFSAQVSGDEDSALTYSWSFGDNLPDSHEASPSVTYTDGGSYTVLLQVTDAIGGAGATTVPITVSGSPSGAPPPATPTPATGTGPSSGTGSNPNGGTHGSGGGNGKGSGKSPSNGNGNGSKGKPSTGPSHPTSTRTQQPSHSGGAGSSGASGSPSVSPSTTSSTTTSSSSSPSASHTAPQRRGNHHTSPRAPSHRRSSPTSGSPGQLVTGRLVADVTPLSADASPLVQRSPGSAAVAPARAGDTGNSPVGVIAGCLAIALLLGLGAGRELLGPGWWRTLRSSS